MGYRVSSGQLVDGAAGNANPIPVASTGVKYTKAINVMYSQYFSLSYQLASSGSPDVQIDMEESVDGLPPVTEGAASANFIIPGAISSIVTDETTKTWKMVTLSPLTARWIRFKLTGKNANPADTTVNGYIHEQSEVS
jgi:hypothetical protein